MTAAGPQFGPPGYEPALSYPACLAALVVGGSGPFAVDGLIANRVPRKKTVQELFRGSPPVSGAHMGAEYGELISFMNHFWCPLNDRRIRVSRARAGKARPVVPSNHGRDGETVSPSPHSSSQTSAGKPTKLMESALAGPSEPASLDRPIRRAMGATWGGSHPLVNLSVFFSGCFVMRES